MVGGPPGIDSALRQMPLLVCNSAGWPMTITRAAGTSHCTRMHGWGFPGGTVNAQPATVLVSLIVATAIPLTITRVFEEMVVTCPACGHMAVAPTW
jgi:hypothetical protein